MNRARTDRQRGFILLAVLVLAILYFALMELMLMQTGEAFRASQRFRQRVVAQVLAENGAELAAQQMVNTLVTVKTYEDAQGKIRGEYRGSPTGAFEIDGKAETKGPSPVAATVHLQGHIENGTNPRIDFASHSQ